MVNKKGLMKASFTPLFTNFIKKHILNREPVISFFELMNRNKRENYQDLSKPSNKLDKLPNCSDINNIENINNKDKILERLKRSYLITNDPTFRTPSSNSIVSGPYSTSTEEVILVDRENPPNPTPQPRPTITTTTTLRPTAEFHVQPPETQPPMISTTMAPKPSTTSLYTVYGPPSGAYCHEVACLEAGGTSVVHCLNMGLMFMLGDNVRPLHSKKCVCVCLSVNSTKSTN